MRAAEPVVRGRDLHADRGKRAEIPHELARGPAADVEHGREAAGVGQLARELIDLELPARVLDRVVEVRNVATVLVALLDEEVFAAADRLALVQPRKPAGERRFAASRQR